MNALWAILLILVLMTGWALNLFGLPGNWLNVAAVICYAWLFPAGQPWSISWWIVTPCSSWQSSVRSSRRWQDRRGRARRRQPPQRRLALAGSLAGSVLGAVIGLPIPFIGSVVAIVLGAGRALGGAMLGESWKGRGLDQGWQVGRAAFWGRLLGTASKLVIGAAIVVIVLAGLALP